MPYSCYGVSPPHPQFVALSVTKIYNSMLHSAVKRDDPSDEPQSPSLQLCEPVSNKIRDLTLRVAMETNIDVTI